MCVCVCVCVEGLGVNWLTEADKMVISWAQEHNVGLECVYVCVCVRVCVWVCVGVLEGQGII